MNASQADEQLMIAVERIVRPIRAMEARKDRMREELLGHLQQLVEREGDLAAALQHLGPPDNLRKQLQGSVPLTERVLFSSGCRRLSRFRLQQRQPGDSDWHYARRVLGHNFIIIAVAFALPLALLTLPGWHARDPEFCLKFMLAMYAAFQLCSVTLVMVGSPMARALAVRDFARAAKSYVLAVSANVLTLMSVLLGYVAWTIGTPWGVIGEAGVWVVIFSVLLAATYPLLSHLTLREADRRCWTELQIDA